MKNISLKNGLFALVDDRLFEQVNSFGKWRAYPSGNTFYARTSINGRTVSMHQLIMLHGWFFCTSKKLEIDHINHNGLDNRLSNLRLVTHSQNISNSSGWKTNTSGYRGVSYYSKLNKWKASVYLFYKHYFCGYFDSKEEAAFAYNNKCIELGLFERIYPI